MGSLKEKYPEISIQFDAKRNKIDVSDLSYGSHIKIWWLCIKGHNWLASVNSRTNRNSGCPYCSRWKLEETEKLEIASKKKRLVSFLEKRPELEREWHSENNKDPNKVAYGSNKLYKWICSNSHEWNASPKNRTGINQTGCPICNRSKGETKVAEWLTDKNFEFCPQYKNSDCRTDSRVLPFDFGVFLNGELKLIEFQGVHHYESMTYCGGEEFLAYRQRLDNIKRDFCVRRGIGYLEFKYDQIGRLDSILNDFLTR